MKQETPEKLHRRQYRNQIVLPVLGILLLLVALVLLAILALNPVQFGILANLMAMLILVPAAITCLIPALGLLFAALWVMLSMGRVVPPLADLRVKTTGYLEKVQQVLPRAAGPVITLQSWFARVERVLPGTGPVSTEKEQMNGE